MIWSTIVVERFNSTIPQHLTANLLGLGRVVEKGDVLSEETFKSVPNVVYFTMRSVGEPHRNLLMLVVCVDKNELYVISRIFSQHEFGRGKVGLLRATDDHLFNLWQGHQGSSRNL